jgi:hypothetical protein
MASESPAATLATTHLGRCFVQWYAHVDMTRLLSFKAGREVLPIIRDEGLRPERVRVFAAPAGGPKWFVSVGFDRALMEHRFLERGDGRMLLVGSSAGGWRCLAMACLHRADAYERLRIAYSRNIFTEADTPRTIGQALGRNVQAFLRDEELGHLLDHPRFDVAVHTVRCKGMVGSERLRVQGAGLLAAACLNALTPRSMRLFFERVIFYAGEEPAFVRNGFPGTAVRLSRVNIRAAALATGSLPYIIAGVNGIPEAPAGVYRDGGLTDYQLNQDYCPGPDGMTLFFHYQERIVPGWFDKPFSWHRPPRGSLDRVLQVYPSREFVDRLPGKKLPDRDDFITFASDPQERIRRWDEAARLSEALGNEFLDVVESGAIRHLVRPLE